MKDLDIVNLYWDRNEDAIHQTQMKYGAYLAKVSYNIISDFEDSKECVNDTYLAAWNSMPTNRPKDLYATDEGGCKYKVEEILLSPVGLHLDMILYDPVFGQAPLMDFEVSLLLKDGTLLPLEGGGGGGMTEGDETMEISYSSMFEIPVPREDIQAIIICDTKYELGNT